MQKLAYLERDSRLTDWCLTPLAQRQGHRGNGTNNEKSNGRSSMKLYQDLGHNLFFLVNPRNLCGFEPFELHRARCTDSRLTDSPSTGA